MFRKLRLQRFQPAWRLTVPRSPWLLILVVPLAMYAWYVAGNDGNSKTEALRRGDELTKKNRPLQAAAAYQIAAERDPNDGEVLVKLAKAYEAGGKWSDAAREGVRAADLLPGNLEVQSLAVTRLNRIRKFFEARARSSRLLESHPDDPDLLVGWANSTSRLPDTSWALYTFPDRVVSADGFDKVRRSLRREIPESDDAEAGAAVRKARRLAPDSWQIQLALVNFLWATGRPDEAEPMLKDLADRNTGHVVVSYALASFYRWRGMDADAETYMKSAAASVQSGRNARFALAEMYIKSNRNEEALAILVAMPATDDESGKASLLAAGIEFQLSLYPAALQRVERLLERFPHNQAAGLLKAQLLFAVGRVDESLKFAREAVTASPRSGEAHAALGQALLATGDLTRAFEEYTEAARLSPAAAKPQWQLARLSLDLGRDKAALVYARNAVREFPGDRDAGVMLVEALIRNRDLSAAEFALRPLQSSFPGSPGVLVQTGALQAARGEARAARASFVKALEIEPHQLPALSGLVALDLQERATASARQSVEAALAAHPDDSKYLLLAARVYTVDNDAVRAEAVLRRVVAVDPFNVEGARALSDCLGAQRREPEARQVLDQLVARLPNSTAAQTVLAMQQERSGDVAGARARYEQIVLQDRRAGIASQRLAALYLNRRENLDKALNLAAVALREFDGDPAVSDLMGWIYVQKGLSVNALPHLEDAVRASPTNAIYRYHLGAAHLRAGNRDKARAELTRALEIDPSLEEARAALAQVRP